MREEEFSSSLSPNATFFGFTALHYAALTDSIGVVKVLLEYGANPLIENEAGHKPLQYAKEGSDIYKLLQEYTAKVGH